MPPRLRAAGLAAIGSSSSASLLQQRGSKKRDVDAEAQAEAGRAGASLPVEWLAALSTAMQPPDAREPALPASVRAAVLACVETLHAGAIAEAEKEKERVLSKGAFEKDQLEKRMGHMRRAGNIEGESAVKILEAKYKAQLEAVLQEVAEAKAACDEKLSVSAAEQEKLLDKITVLDGGLEKARREKEMQARRVQERAVRRMRNATLAAGFTTWRSASGDVRRMRNAAKRLSRAGVARCFATWLEAIDEQQRMTRMLAGAAGRMKRPALASALSHWKHDWREFQRFASEGGVLGRVRQLEAELAELREAGDALVKQAEERIKDEHNERLVRMSAMRMRGLRSVSALVRWGEGAAERRRLRSGIARLLNAKVAAAWGTWAPRAVSRVEARQVGRAARLRRGLGGWQAGRQARQWQRAAATRIVNHQIAAGFDGWRSALEERERLVGLQMMAINQLRRPKLASSFSCWKQDWQDDQPEDLWSVEGLTRALDRAQAKAADAAASAAADAEAALAAAQEAQRVAEGEAQRRGEAIARLEREGGSLRREREGLRKELGSLEASMRDELRRAREKHEGELRELRKALAAEVAEERQEAERVANELEDVTARLEAETVRADAAAVGRARAAGSGACDEPSDGAARRGHQPAAHPPRAGAHLAVGAA